MDKINVVLSGSGTLYPIHVGALWAITELYIVDAIAGTSGGAIVAGTYASTGSVAETEDSILNTLPGPNKLIDKRCFIDIAMSKGRKGLVAGNKLLNAFKDKMVVDFGSTVIDLGVYVTDIKNRHGLYFSSSGTPGMNLPLAVRASMSYPFMFDPVVIGDMFLIDGGTVKNFAADTFNGSDYHTIAISVERKTVPRPIKSWKDFVGFTVDTMLESMMKEDEEDAEGVTIIKIPGVGDSFDFNMTKDEAMKLIDHGYNVTMAKLSHTSKI